MMSANRVRAIQEHFEANFFLAFANLHSLLAIRFSFFYIIGVMEIDLYSSGNWVGVLSFGIG